MFSKYLNNSGRLDNSRSLSDFSGQELISILENNSMCNPMDLSYICSEILRRQIKCGKLDLESEKGE